MDGVKPVIRRKKRGLRQLFRSAVHHMRLCACPVGMAGCVFVLTFVKWFHIPSPFAAAFVLAVSARKLSAALLAGLGASLGLRFLWGIESDLWQYAGCAGLWMVLRKIRPKPGIETAALGGLAMIPRILAAILGGNPLDLLLSFAALPLCMLFSTLLRYGADSAQMELRQGWERLCLLLCAGLVVSGLGYFHLGPVHLGMAAALLACCVFARANGPVYGVFGGMLCGLMLLLGGHSGGLMLFLPLCGLMGGIPVMGRRRWLVIPVSFAANAAAWCILMTVQPPAGWFSVGAGGLLYLLLPSSLLERLDPWIKGAPEGGRSMENAFVTQRIAHMQSAIQALARALPDWDEEADAELLRDSLCSRCHQQSQCWDKDRARTEKRLLQAAESNTGLTNCPHADRLPEAARKMQRRSAAGRRFRYERELTLTHLAALSGTLDALGAMSSGESYHDLRSAHVITLALEELDVPARLIYARRVDGHLQAALEAEGSVSRSLEKMLQLLAKEEDLALSVTRSEKGRIELEEVPLYAATVGMTCMSKDGGKDSLCGDTCCARRCEGGRMLLMLCDGMGHGEMAHKQSEKTQELLLLLLQAGYTRRQAITAVNGMMLGAQEAERYSTVDLADVDLWTGEVYGEKLGACASWIIRGRHMKKIEGSSLPLGILQEASPAAAQFRMHSGDILVMMSDGVADAFSDDEELKKALSESLFIQPQRMADALVRNALVAGGGTPRDDMSVLVLLMMDRQRNA